MGQLLHPLFHGTLPLLPVFILSDGASWGRILNKQFAFKPLSQSLCWGDLAVGQGLTFTPVQGH